MNSLNRFYPLLLSVYLLPIVYVGYFSTQNQFTSIIIPSAIAFWGYLLIIRYIDKPDKINQVLVSILLIKISLLFSFPHLTNDIFRFWWDGFLSSHGFNPYEFTPTEIIYKLQNEQLYTALQANYPLLNSASYHTVYPMVCQWIFRLATSLSGDNLYLFNLILKLAILIADCLILFYLRKILNILQYSGKNVLLFFGNPLCIIELNTNLHFEIFLILFLVISIFFILKENAILSGLNLGLSIVSKLISFLWIPIFIKRPFINISSLQFLAGLGLPICIFLFTIYPAIGNYQHSLGLYFQKFEFNSFIYSHLFNFFNYQKWYYAQSIISVILMSIFISLYLVIIIKHWIENKPGFAFKSSWLIIFLYLLLSTTVHPWYLTPLLLLSVFAFPGTGLVWSFLILLSYSRYDPQLNSFESILVLFEYVIVMCFFIYEWKNGSLRFAATPLTEDH